MMQLILTVITGIMISVAAFAADETGVNTTSTPTASAISTAASMENQIPLNIDVVKKTSDVTPASNRILFTALIIAAMLGVAYYSVRKYKNSNSINKSNMQIKVLSQHYLGPKKSLAIIHVAGESMLVGITDSNISMIKSLSLIDDEVPVTVPKTFNEAMSTTKNNAVGATAKNSGTSVDDNELEEEFSFSGLKDTVSKKLKSMRSI